MAVEVKQIVDEYILLVFDIPANQGKLRKRFLREAAAAGAVMFTQSVYLLPYSDAMQALANDLAATGKAVIWRSKQEDPEKAKSITIKYNDHLIARCAVIEQRLYQIKDHVDAGHLDKANRMAKKSHLLLQQLVKISETFNPPWLKPQLAILGQNMKQVYGTAPASNSDSSTSCPKCGAEMGLAGVDIYKCKQCGHEVDMLEDDQP